MAIEPAGSLERTSAGLDHPRTRKQPASIDTTWIGRDVVVIEPAGSLERTSARAQPSKDKKAHR